MQEEYIKDLLSLKEKLNVSPEPFGNLVQTKNIIFEFLQKQGIDSQDIHEINNYGFYVDLKGKQVESKASKGIAFCTGIDAIKSPSSGKDGYSHSKGNDINTTILLGVVHNFLKHASDYSCNSFVRIIFQAGKEEYTSSKHLIEEGEVLKGINEIYSIQIQPKFSSKQVIINKGNVLPYFSSIEIQIIGKGGHSSIIEKLKDPLRPGLQIYQKLNEIRQKLDQSYKDEYKLALPQIINGEAPNVVNDDCTLKGIISAFQENIIIEAYNKLEKVVEEACQEYECKGSIQRKELSGLVSNDQKLQSEIAEDVKAVIGDENLLQNVNFIVNPGDDFSNFIKKVPGCLVFVGTGEQTPLYSSDFKCQDESVVTGINLISNLLKNRFA